MAEHMSEQEYLKSHNVVQIFDEMTAALLAEKPEEPTQFIMTWLKDRFPRKYKLNTSNQNKFKEFQRIFGQFDIELEATQIDLAEIDAEPEKVIAHKATTAGENVVVEDTALDVEGADVGVNVRWLMDNLGQYVGRKATWRVLLGVQRGNQVDIYEGVTKGRVVQPRGDSNFGFDPIFEVEGMGKTLAEAKPDEVNARAKAIANMVRGKIFRREPLITQWEGKWQH